MQVIFENLNIKVLNVTNIKSELMTSKFYDMIKNCHSLRSVEFAGIDDVHAQLDVYEANLHVKTWTLSFEEEVVTDSVKERLTTMFSDRNDNSLLVFTDSDILDDIPQIKQTFKLSPV